MNAAVPLWIEALVGALLVASGIASIVAAVGLVRLLDVPPPLSKR